MASPWDSLPAHHGQLCIAPALPRDGAGTTRQGRGRCPGPRQPRLSLPKNPLPCLVLPVNHGRPGFPTGKGLCQTYIKKRIKPGSSIAPDLWLHQPWEGGRDFFPFSFPDSTPSRGCRAVPQLPPGLLFCSHGSIPRWPELTAICAQHPKIQAGCSNSHFSARLQPQHRLMAPKQLSLSAV